MDNLLFDFILLSFIKLADFFSEMVQSYPEVNRAMQWSERGLPIVVNKTFSALD